MRNISHFLISLVLWGIFFYHWHIVSRQEVTTGTTLAIKTLSTLVVIGIAITVLWVAHNLRIAKVNQRKENPHAPQDILRKDTLGRAIEALDVQKLKLADLVDIEVTEDLKIYRSGEGEG